MLSAMAPCAFCNDLTDAKRLVPIAEIQRGVQNHCEGCELLDTSVTAFRDRFPHIHAILWHIDRLLCVRLLDSRMQEMAIMELYTDPGRQTPWPIIGPARTVPMESWDAATVKLARAWLNDCAHHHTICRLPRAYELPTRVIDVGTDSVHLYVTQKENAQYAALSHCWGGERPIVSTRANLEQHQNEITFDASAKSFAHAVQVTRDLGLRYLWIDSLCIIQDDPQDWATEAAKMAQVYKNATVTISAEAARGTSEGLFVNQDRRKAHQVVQHINVETNESPGLTINARLRSSSSRNATHMSHSSTAVPIAPLSTRAWTLQERLLSTRVLHFFEEELVWCCNSVSRCQCRIDAGLPVVSAFKMLDNEKREGQLEYDLSDEWPDIVNQFTARAMTKATDRLPALSGLASLFSAQTSQTYYAGLWQADVAFGLLWISDHDRAGENAIQRYTAEELVPSWSWASVIGPVKYLPRHKNQFERQNTEPALKPRLEPLFASVQSDPLMPFGSAVKGVVAVHGQLLAVTFDPSRNVWRPKVSEPEEEPAPDPKVEPKVIFDVLSEGPSSSTGDEATEYFLLRAATYVKGIFSMSSRENFCLLLQRTFEPNLSRAFNNMVFRRCGVVFYAFASERVWFEENPPKVKLVIV